MQLIFIVKFSSRQVASVLGGWSVDYPTYRPCFELLLNSTFGERHKSGENTFRPAQPASRLSVRLDATRRSPIESLIAG